MHALAQSLADEPQPRNSGMGGFRHRSLHVEMKHRFCTAGAFLCQARPAAIASANGAITAHALTERFRLGLLLDHTAPVEVCDWSACSGPLALVCWAVVRDVSLVIGEHRRRSGRWKMEPQFKVQLKDASEPPKHFRSFVEAETFAKGQVASGEVDEAQVYEVDANGIRLVRVVTPKASEEEIEREKHHRFEIARARGSRAVLRALGFKTAPDEPPLKRRRLK